MCKFNREHSRLWKVRLLIGTDFADTERAIGPDAENPSKAQAVKPRAGKTTGVVRIGVTPFELPPDHSRLRFTV